MLLRRCHLCSVISGVCGVCGIVRRVIGTLRLLVGARLRSVRLVLCVNSRLTDCWLRSVDFRQRVVIGIGSACRPADCCSRRRLPAGAERYALRGRQGLRRRFRAKRVEPPLGGMVARLDRTASDAWAVRRRQRRSRHCCMHGGLAGFSVPGWRRTLRQVLQRRSWGRPASPFRLFGPRRRVRWRTRGAPCTGDMAFDPGHLDHRTTNSERSAAAARDHTASA
jgi:hypothetical protein